MAAWAHGDYEAAADSLDADVEWHNTASFPGPTVIRGVDAVKRFWADLDETIDATGGRSEILRLSEANEGVAVELRGRARGKASSVPLDVRWAHVARIRGAKVVRVDTHGSYEKALRAEGMEA